MGITVNTSPQQITASVGETKIDVSVSGGIGPTGPAGEVGGGYTLPVATASVLGGVKIGSGVTITDGVISVSTNYAAASHSHSPADVTTETTYTNFLPEGGSLATALSEIDSVLSGKAGTGDLVYVSGAGSHSVKPAGADATVGNYSVILGGDPQSAAGNSSVICGGSSNSIAGDYSSVLGGFSNSGGEYDNVHLIGSHITAAASDYTLVNNLHIVGAWNGSALAGGVLKFPDGTTMSTAGAALSHTHSASDVTSGTLDIARIPTGTSSTTVCIGNDARLSDARTPTAHNHAASDINSGVIATARLASSGTASATTFLRGDQTWATAGSTNASDLTSGTLAYARMADPTVTSPSQITSNQNDYASFARGINRFTTNAARDITGMVAGSDGEIRVLCNVGTTAANTLVIKDESSSSTAANRFSVPWNGDCVIPAEGSVVVFYDGTSSRWRVV